MQNKINTKVKKKTIANTNKTYTQNMKQITKTKTDITHDCCPDTLIGGVACERFVCMSTQGVTATCRTNDAAITDKACSCPLATTLQSPDCCTVLHKKTIFFSFSVALFFFCCEIAKYKITNKKQKKQMKLKYAMYSHTVRTQQFVSQCNVQMRMVCRQNVFITQQIVYVVVPVKTQKNLKKKQRQRGLLFQICVLCFVFWELILA